MPSTRGFAIVVTTDQWKRASHFDTTIDLVEGCVELAWKEPKPPSRQARGGEATALAGLAFDAHCRLYRSVPAEGRIERILWRAHDPLATPEQTQPELDVGADPAPSFGDFQPDAPLLEPMRYPTGLAVDIDDRLFVAESGQHRILVFDLWSRRLLRRVEFDSRPVDLAAADDGRSIWALGHDPACLVQLRARNEPAREELPNERLLPPEAIPIRLAASPDGVLYILYAGATARDRWIVYRRREGTTWTLLEHGDRPHTLARAGDLEVVDETTLVVAREAGQSFLRLSRERDAWSLSTPLLARDYDGSGIVRTPDARLGFWTANGFREAVAARVSYSPSGRVSTFRLDSGDYQTQWGRIFVDACIPPGTSVRAAFASTDDEDEGAATIPWHRPATGLGKELRPGSPPLVPISLAPTAETLPQALHLRETGRELPWARSGPDDPFETYEAPIGASPGRYLWVTLELLGTTRTTPRVRCLRAEHPTHDYLSRLPRTFSYDQEAAAFLARYLAMFEGMLGDLDARSAERRALLDPSAAPGEILGWLAGFLGLVLDERWPDAVRRRLIAEASCLFRFRGTVRGLERFLEIVLGSSSRVMLLERWRFRGLGGAYSGGDSAPAAGDAVVGASFRVGGSVSASPSGPVAPGTRPEDAFRTHAHRFSVVIPAAPGPAELDVVRHVLELHRPAHTIYDICTVGSGMRVGRGLHVGLLSLVGPTGRFATAQLGSSQIGSGTVIGRPVLGVRPGSSRLARTATIG